MKRAQTKKSFSAPAERQLFQLAVEAAPNGMLLIGEDGRIVLVNTQAEKLFGYDRGELIGKTMEILVPERFRRAHSGYRADFFAKPGTRAMGAGRNLFGARKDGTELPVEIGLNPVETAEGRFVLASIIDITERKSAEDRFRLAVEAAPNGMLMVGRDGKIVLANSQTEKLFGYSPGELIGKTMEVLVPERFRGAHPGHRDGFFRRPSTRSMGAGRDLFGLRKDGREVPVEIGLNPIETPEGAFVLASIIDITQRRALERQLARSEALASVGGMVSVVAHEIRNPLGSIVMAAEAMARGDLGAEDRDQVLGVLAKESKRLNRTLTEFLQFARPREPRLEPGDLNVAASEVLTAARADPALLGKTKVKASFAPELPEVAFDADQIRQVLWNLIRNALQAVGGEGRVEIKTEARLAEVVVSVRDSGPGISPELLDKLFMPFFTTKAQGTGLGLATSRSIMSAHGGEIHVESSPGKGSLFCVVLPLTRPR